MPPQCATFLTCVAVRDVKAAAAIHERRVAFASFLTATVPDPSVAEAEAQELAAVGACICRPEHRGVHVSYSATMLCPPRVDSFKQRKQSCWRSSQPWTRRRRRCGWSAWP